MNLLDIVNRVPVPEPWAEGDKIPWHDPAFSERMLREHLSQAHDRASRRFAKVDQQVHWIHRTLLNEQPTRILDLGCGPGLYAERLARLGHTCVGIDFSPASIRHARETAQAASLSCTYHMGDIRQADYGSGFGLAMLIFGEFNVFPPQDAKLILKKASDALCHGGILLLEPHTFAAMRQMGELGTTWYSSHSGLFSAQPYLCLMETFWDAACHTVTERYWVIDAVTGSTVRHASTGQAYTDDEYRALLAACGLSEITFYPSLIGEPDPTQASLFALAARKTSP